MSEQEEFGENEAFELAVGKYPKDTQKEGTKDKDEVKPILLKVSGVQSFGKRLFAFTPTEHSDLTAFNDLIKRYAGQKGHKRPLCFAVFGPPGSGKSTAVEAIVENVNDTLREANAPRLFLMPTINLTQVSSYQELAGAIVANLAAAQDAIPVLFLDEFDAPYGGHPLGWLQWFLAPMNDGEFLHGGRRVPCKRAIFFFAGGTADTYDDFSRPGDYPKFRDAKGPDFLSRLDRHLDIEGPNADPRLLRRAFFLRLEFNKRVQELGLRDFEIGDERRGVLESLLKIGRYRHGGRSIRKLVGAIDLHEKAKLQWEMLPDDSFLRLQVDRGPLDYDVIHGSIALSGSRSDEADDNADEHEDAGNRIKQTEVVTEVANALLKNGATLGYAGPWKHALNQNLLGILMDVFAGLPKEPSNDEEKRNAPRARLRCIMQGYDDPLERKAREDLLRDKDIKKLGLKLVHLYESGNNGSSGAGARDWKVRITERFRRRLAMVEDSVAHFAVGGNDKPSEKARPSGVIEEVILSLALGHPVYLAGGFEGATRPLGALLGLGEVWTGEVPELFKQSAVGRLPELKEMAKELRPPPLENLPVTAAEQARFLQEHVVWGCKWPANGLNLQENRKLFASTIPEEVARLVVEGLLRNFGTR